MRKCMDFADIRSVGQAVGFVSDWSCLYIYIYICAFVGEGPILEAEAFF